MSNKKIGIILKQYNVTPQQAEYVVQLAARRGTSASQIIRDLIDAHIKKYSENK